jgi:MFS family permease
VFGVSSVAGPLLGGWLTGGPGWQWIFWINIPIGIAALIVTSIALKIPTVRRDHVIDYLGAALIVASVTSILLYTAWAGTRYGWTDPLSLTLLGAGIMLAGLFVVVELRAAEPIVPMRLFRNRVYTPTIVFTAIMGLAMFGGIIFLPVYLQVVQGMSPTESGLALLPMVAGIFTTSISSGRRVSRTGRYRIYPILGAAVIAIAMALMSTLDARTPYWLIATYFFVFGAGLGFTMQIVVTAVQNAVDRRDMGAATSSVTFFRSMGAAFGTALFGAILTSRLGHYLAAAGGGILPTGADEAEIANNVKAIQALPAEVKAVVIDAWVRSLHDVFLTAVPLVAVGLVAAFFIPEMPLRGASDVEPILATE